MINQRGLIANLFTLFEIYFVQTQNKETTASVYFAKTKTQLACCSGL
jgi:hypothetical protein